MDINARSPVQEYGEAFLTTLLEVHQEEWESIQSMASDAAAGKLEKELVRLEDRVRAAEDDEIEFMRLNDITRLQMRGTLEARYLESLLSRRNELVTELMLLEAQFPALKEANPVVLRQLTRLTERSSAAGPGEVSAVKGGNSGGSRGGSEEVLVWEKDAPAEGMKQMFTLEDLKDIAGWQDIKVRIELLKKQEQDLADKVLPEHPELKKIRADIAGLQRRLEEAARIELENMKDRRSSLQIALNALEEAEYKWHAKSLLASKKQAEYRRKQAAVQRYESQYHTFYARLADMRTSEELKAEHIRLLEPVKTADTPAWPDPLRIFPMALVLGLGCGLGLAVLAHVLDNKVQTISDVESELGLAFLGGIPRWVRHGVERTVRPIVTEEHATGAIEAYRALRTNVVAALGAAGAKTLIVTSADSREGKTLTVLNLGIMMGKAGKRVLLVDMDLRRGRMHHSVGIPREPGFNDVLNGCLPMADVIKETRFENVWGVMAGPIEEKAAELLHAADLRTLFSQVEAKFDYILLDTPPILRVTDTAIIVGKGVGAVMVVSHANRTPKTLVRYAIDLLGEAKIIGVVVNSLDMHRISSLYYSYLYPNYAYYSNAYAYGYDYYYDERRGGRFRSGMRQWSWSRLRRNISGWVRRTILPVE